MGDFLFVTEIKSPILQMACFLISSTQMNSPSLRNLALVWGISFIIMALLSGVGYFMALEPIYTPGDALATAKALIENELLFRLFILSFVGILFLDVVISWAFYLFFKNVNSNLSLLSMLFRMTWVAFTGVGFLSLIWVLLLSKWGVENANQILLGIDGFLNMWSLALMFFGFSLLTLSYILFKSGFVPKTIAYLTLIGGILYFWHNFLHLLLPLYGEYKATIENYISLPLALGELWIAFWLIMRWGK